MVRFRDVGGKDVGAIGQGIYPCSTTYNVVATRVNVFLFKMTCDLSD
jgi:hypothetical protein